VVGFLGYALFLAGRPREAVLALEESLRVSGGFDGDHRGILAEVRKAFAPDLASCTSIDAALGGVEDEHLVGAGASVRIAPGGGDPLPGPAWTEPSFDDSAWKEIPLTSAPGPSSLRMVFEIEGSREAIRCSLTLRSGTALAAFLNGREAGRLDEAPGNPLTDGLSRLDLEVDPGLLRAGRNVLAIRLEGSSKAGSIPDVHLRAAFAAEPAKARRILQEFRAVARGPEAAGHIAYGEGRLLEREGKIRDAVSKYEEAAALDRCCHEPAFRLAERLIEMEDLTAAEDRLRKALEGSLSGRRELWDLWARLELGKLGRSAREALEGLPGKDEPPDPSARPASTILPGFGRRPSTPREDMKWLLEELASGRPVRIDCGGEGYRSPSGAVWGPDRFFVLGSLYYGDGVGVTSGPFTDPIAGTEDAPLYRTTRSPPAYRIPLPRGSWRVTLHFASIQEKEQGGMVFDVLLDGKRVLEGYDPARAGFAAASARSFEVGVEDGVLEIEFRSRSQQCATVSAIEIAPRPEPAR